MGDGNRRGGGFCGGGWRSGGFGDGWCGGSFGGSGGGFDGSGGSFDGRWRCGCCGGFGRRCRGGAGGCGGCWRLGWRGCLCVRGGRRQQGDEGAAEGQEDAEDRPLGTWGHRGILQRGYRRLRRAWGGSCAESCPVASRRNDEPSEARQTTEGSPEGERSESMTNGGAKGIRTPGLLTAQENRHPASKDVVDLGGLRHGVVFENLARSGSAAGDARWFCVTATRFHGRVRCVGALTMGWHPRLPLCQRYALSEMAFGQAVRREHAWLPSLPFGLAFGNGLRASGKA